MTTTEYILALLLLAENLTIIIIGFTTNTECNRPVENYRTLDRPPPRK